MKNVFNPLRGKLFPLVLASIVLLLNTTHVFQAEDIIPYNSPYIVDTVNYKNEKIQPNTTAMHHGSNKSTLFALNKQSMSVIYKSLTAIIGIFAMSLMIVSCMRYLNKNKYRQLQSRRLAGNGTDGCGTEGDNKDQGAAANASDEDTDDDSDGDDIDPELLKDEDHDIPYNVTEEEIIESINYLQGVSADGSPVLSEEELKEQLKKETKEYEAGMVAKAEKLFKDPTSEIEKDGSNINDVIELQKDIIWTDIQTISYGSDPTLLNTAVTQCTRVLEKAGESNMGDYVNQLLEFVKTLNGEIISDGFENEGVAEEIQKLKQKVDLSELERGVLHIYDALLPNLVEQNNSNANEKNLLDRGFEHMNKSEAELLDEAIQRKLTPLYSDKSDSEEEAEGGAAAETAK